MTDIVDRLRHCSENCGDEYLHELSGKAADEIERLRVALRRIDRMEVYEADAHVVLWGKIGIMRDIARAALGEKETSDD